ncbi:MAG TPA: TIGR02444 family protein [Afipia sp.]
MTSSRSDLDADSWAFDLRVYAWPGVADACLTLQDRAGVDVMLLLICAFASVEKRILLTQAEIREIDEACRPWREEVVRSLRLIRKRLKTGPPPAPDDKTEQFRKTIKVAELAAERLQNRLLADRLPLKPAERNAISPEDVRNVLRTVVRLALERQDKGETEIFDHPIDVIVAAAMQHAP